MNEYLNPSCISSLATSCVEFAMVISLVEGKVATAFTEGVSSSAEAELVIDENASTVSLVTNLCVVRIPSVVMKEGEECARDLLDYLCG